MKLSEVQDKVQRITNMQEDAEGAHSEEDDLYLSVLSEVAKGHDHNAELAREALKTQALNFSRWCA